MPRPLNDSSYLYGLHDPGGESILAERNTFGWILFTEKLGSDPGNHSGHDYSSWANRGFGIIARLNNGYSPEGTIPNSSRYAPFAQRCANFAASSAGCHIWIIGNEPNLPVERPGVSFDGSGNPTTSGEVIVPGMYADCYQRCRVAIKNVPGHQADQVIAAGIGPWNNQTAYPGNPQGDWVTYLADVLKTIGAGNCDGIAIHAYTHGRDPSLVYSDTFMQPPFEHRHYDFRCYQDFMGAIPRDMRALPVYLTETDQGEPWLNQNVGWVQRVYGEIDWWNRQPCHQTIRAVILYRWQKDDQWAIDGKAGVIEDLRQAMAYGYAWPVTPPPPVYGADFLSQNTPSQMDAGHTVQVTLVWRNSACKPWNRDQVQAGYHWLNGSGQPVIPAPEPAIRTPLPRTVQPDETVQIQAGVAAPGDAGAYRLQWDLVEGNDGWFAAMKASKPASVEVNVQQPDVSQQIAQLKAQVAQLQAQTSQLQAQNSLLQTQNSLLQGQVSQLQAQIVQLQAEIANLQAKESGGNPPPPPITDITLQLPRDPAGFAKRSAQNVKYIVINHTAVRPEVGAAAVARAQRARWPGIVSQYYITGDGQIQQTEPLDEAVSQDLAWFYNGINIYVAGNFNETVPVPAQLSALSQLVAWLMAKYGLDASALRGASEFVATQSPGIQWMTGWRWKDMLLQQVRAILGKQTGSRAQPSAEQPQPGQPQAAEQNAPGVEQQAQPARLASEPEPPAQAESRAGLGASGVATGLRSQVSETQYRMDLPGVEIVGFEDGETPALSRDVAPPAILAVQPLAAPPVTDVSQRLPHDDGALKSRPADQIRFLVINHTAVDANIGVERVAAAHQKRWGAILYEYFIGPDGAILQTGPVEAVVDLSQPWIAQAINIGLAGNFNDNVPPQAQIDAAARLSAWLMQEYHIPADRIKGASEFIATQSPGLQWSQGKAWKNTLLDGIARVQNSGTAELAASDVARLQASLLAAQNSLAALSGERDQLRTQAGASAEEKNKLMQQVQALTGNQNGLAQQIQSLTGDNKNLGAQLPAAQQQVSDLQARVQTLHAGPGQPATPARVARPAIQDITDQLPKHPTARYDTRTLNSISHLAIHHSAAPANVAPASIAAYHVSQGWPGIGYHFLVEADGTIYQVNRLETIAYNVYNNNRYLVGICTAGNFNDVIPTPLQIERLGDLVAWLMQELKIPIEMVLGHKEYPENATACPGNQWQAGQNWRDLLRARVRTVQAAAAGCASVRHYLLFWQNAADWARDDWNGAINYIARFHPSAGFSPEDARSARYLTIVGGPLGVSPQVEQDLSAAGCKVERIGGDSPAETKQMLDDLAAAGKEFKTFDA